MPGRVKTVKDGLGSVSLESKYDGVVVCRQDVLQFSLTRATILEDLIAVCLMYLPAERRDVGGTHTGELEMCKYACLAS